MTQQYGHGYKAVQYIGSKTQKEFHGYIWSGNGDILPLPYDVAVKALTHSDVFSEVGAQAVSASFAAAAGAANVTEVTITMLDANGEACDEGVSVLEVYLSDDAEGDGLTGTTASGTVQPKTSEGTQLVEHTAKKHLKVATKKDAGTFILEITDASKTGFYVCAVVGGIVFVSDQLVAGDYGA